MLHLLLPTLLSTLLLLTTPTHATNSTILVKNNCPFPLYITSVSSTVGPTIPLGGGGGTWTEPQHKDPLTGIAIKVAVAQDALYASKPVLTFGYTVDYGVPDVYYDLTTTYGFAEELRGKKIAVKGDEGKGVPGITWEGAPPGEQQTKRFVGTTDLTLEVCS
ncbi:hypothetical protein BU24DRAFT_403801 [Aaosphaeria arxii CBS 175.79]|uniref:Uncharacterized protein n=1 Tax=Aaosphaeria arxii CBS 175.79 TaxID=1450172 RepID=A0A6A5Y7E3_9PLEO|nr:uncharacterized protein BU24DRAFT_403801 [Aaosphaeria arxii CBS 175.79]KAF2020720.1 hypothetical protein BU24DRAFT_403801 [Aaosphaeria arxii CBS 175.79]